MGGAHLSSLPPVPVPSELPPGSDRSARAVTTRSRATCLMTPKEPRPDVRVQTSPPQIHAGQARPAKFVEAHGEVFKKELQAPPFLLPFQVGGSIPLRLFPEIKTCQRSFERTPKQTSVHGSLHTPTMTEKLSSTAQRNRQVQRMASTPTHHPQFQNCVLRSALSQEEIHWKAKAKMVGLQIQAWNSDLQSPWFP